MKRALLLSALFLNFYVTAQDTVYVDADATGANDGTSWADAFTDLYTAVDYTNANMIGTQYWVAEGIYSPESNQMPIMILYGEKIYGGFNGTESDLSQRNPELYKTIFTGDINGNDSAGTFYDNAPRIFDVSASIGAGDTAEVVFDGITITSAHTPNGSGGGIFCHVGQRALKVNNCIFQNNRALNRASILFYSVYPDAEFTLTNSIFRNNVNQHYDIEFRITGQNSTTRKGIIANCLFENNTTASLANASGALLGRFTNLSLGTQEIHLVNNTFVNNFIYSSNADLPSLFAMETNGNSSDDIIVHAYNNLFYKNFNIDELIMLTNSYAVTGLQLSTTNTNGGDLSALNMNMLSSVYDTASPFVNYDSADYRPNSSFAAAGTVSAYNSYALPNVDLDGNNRFDVNGGIAIGALQGQVSGLGIKESSAGLAIYPNPVQEVLHVEADFPIRSLQVINAQGQLVYRSKAAKQFKVKLNLSGFKAGLYWIQIEGEGQLKTESVIKY